MGFQKGTRKLGGFTYIKHEEVALLGLERRKLVGRRRIYVFWVVSLKVNDRKHIIYAFRVATIIYMIIKSFDPLPRYLSIYGTQK